MRLALKREAVYTAFGSEQEECKYIYSNMTKGFEDV